MAPGLVVFFNPYTGAGLNIPKNDRCDIKSICETSE